MASKNKFEKMIEQNSKKRAVSSDEKIQREAEKQNDKRTKIRLQEFKRSEPENYKKAVILSKKYGTRVEDYIGVDLSFVDKKGNILEGNTQNLTNPVGHYRETGFVPSEKTDNHNQKPVIEEKQDVKQHSNKVEKIDLSELRNLQEEMRKEQGIEPVDTTYKVSKQKEDEDETENVRPEETEKTLAPENKNNNPFAIRRDVPENVETTQPENQASISESLSENENQDKEQKIEEKVEEQTSSNNEEISQNQQEEYESAQTPVKPEKYENPDIEKKLNSHVSKIDFSELEKAKNEIEDSKNGNSTEEKQPVKKAKTNIIFGMSNNSLKETVYEDLTEINAGKKVTEQTNAKPKEEAPNEFEGWSKEDIAAELERRRRLADLKQKYSDEQGKDPKDIGEYKKSLDFSINQDIKRFRMKPPKKPIIISLVLLFAMIIAAVATTIIILKKPPEPAYLVSAKISQSTTYQFVGETVDLRGLYIQEVYSDGSTKSVVVDKSMISKKSDNINDNLLIASNNAYTYIEFSHNGKSQVLQISLNERIVSSINSVEIYQEGITNGSVLKFDNILILANVRNSANEQIGIKRILAKDVSFEVEGVALEKTTDGVKIEGLTPGTIMLKISYTENNSTFTKTVEIVID